MEAYIKIWQIAIDYTWQVQGNLAAMISSRTICDISGTIFNMIICTKEIE